MSLDVILEILKFTIPGIIVLIATYAIVSKFIKAETRRRELDIYAEGLKMTLPLRLQAYERLSIFLERMHPRSLIPRVYRSGMTVRDLQTAIVNSIKQEFDHNLSQQIYVTGKTWKSIVGIKEQTLSMVNQIAAGLNPNDPATVLHQRILDYVVSGTSQELPVTIGLEIVRNEAKMVLAQQG